jgi:hypothetical protein
LVHPLVTPTGKKGEGKLEAMVPIGFYDYRLLDPRDGLCFYIGKGQRDRAWQHERYVKAMRSSGNARKDQLIRDILATGQSVKIEIAAIFDCELEALDHEYRLVEADPTLTNVMPGGLGGKVDTPLQQERRRKVYLYRRQKLIDGRKAAIRAKIEERVTRNTNFLKTDRWKDHIDSWLAGLSDEEIASLWWKAKMPASPSHLPLGLEPGRIRKENRSRGRNRRLHKRQLFAQFTDLKATQFKP